MPLLSLSGLRGFVGIFAGQGEYAPADQQYGYGDEDHGQAAEREADVLVIRIVVKCVAWSIRFSHAPDFNFRNISNKPDTRSALFFRPIPGITLRRDGAAASAPTRGRNPAPPAAQSAG